MRRRLFVLLAAFVVVAACGGSTSTVGSSNDGGGTGGDGAPLGDGAMGGDEGLGTDGGGGMDVVADVPAEATTCDACKPDFCGCGQCSDDQVVCTKTPAPCPILCATACDLTKYKCACDADRCVRTSPAPGTLIPCYTTLDCPPGKCCQPRGSLQGACVAGNGC